MLDAAPEPLPLPAQRPLFRPQALTHGRGMAAGPMALMPHGPGAKVAWSLGLAVLALGLTVAQLPYARSVKVQGVLVPTQEVLRVEAPVAAAQLRWRVQEGQTVVPGQVLAELSSSVSDGGDILAEDAPVALNPNAAVEQTWAQRRQALINAHRHQTQISQLERQRLSSQLALMQQQRSQWQSQQDLLRQKMQLAEQQWQRQQMLQETGFVSAAAADQGRLQGIQERQQWQQWQERGTEIDRQIQSLRQALQELEPRLQLQSAQHLQALAALDAQSLEWTQRNPGVVRAHKAGTVGPLMVAPGQSVQAGQVLCELQPSGAMPLQAELWVPSRAGGHLAIGQTVVLQVAAFPALRFGTLEGRVTHISSHMWRPADLARQHPVLAQRAAVDGADHVWQVRVALPADRPSLPSPPADVTPSADFTKHPNTEGSRALRAGMVLEARLKQEPQAIWRWVLKPLWTRTT